MKIVILNPDACTEQSRRVAYRGEESLSVSELRFFAALRMTFVMFSTKQLIYSSIDYYFRSVIIF